MKKLIYLEDAIALAQSIEDRYSVRSVNVDYTPQILSHDGFCTLANPAKETAQKWGHIADGAEKVKEALKTLPTAEPERKTGYWIPQDHNKHIGTSSTLVYYYPICSKCGHSGNYNMNYCPNCGARMEELT